MVRTGALRWRPSSRGERVGGSIHEPEKNESRPMGRPLSDRRPSKYLFGRLAQTTAGVTARADWTFTPYLSLQLYAQPFVSAGVYDNFKRVVDSRARDVR